MKQLTINRISVDAGLFHDAKEFIFIYFTITIFIKLVNHGS